MTAVGRTACMPWLGKAQRDDDDPRPNRIPDPRRPMGSPPTWLIARWPPNPSPRDPIPICSIMLKFYAGVYAVITWEENTEGKIAEANRARSRDSLCHGPHRCAIIADPAVQSCARGPPAILSRAVALTVGVWGSRRGRVEEMPVLALGTHLAGPICGSASW